MFDRFNRKIDYLRVSVTDRCNLRCAYCMPESGVEWIPREKILSYEEIVEVVRSAVGMGITRVRLTGGEPLVRREIVDLVAMLAKIPGLTDLAMTTNGILLQTFAEPLARAGLQRINVSLDTMDPARFAQRTRGGELNRVLAGIDAAKKVGFSAIKLNCVVERSSDEPDAQAVARFARENNFPVRFIRRMDLAKGEFWVVESGTGGKCSECNRLRLSSDGLVRPCLFNDLAFSVRELGAAEALRRAVETKPPSGQRSLKNRFHSIGG